jgi:hypothetical protein
LHDGYGKLDWNCEYGEYNYDSKYSVEKAAIWLKTTIPR